MAKDFCRQHNTMHEFVRIDFNDSQYPGVWIAIKPGDKLWKCTKCGMEVTARNLVERSRNVRLSKEECTTNE